MYTKDGMTYGGFLDREHRTFVNWKNPLREISCSRTNVKDKMGDACGIAEVGGVSAYGERNYDDENVGNSEVEVLERSLNAGERSEFGVGGCAVESESHGTAAVMRYVYGLNSVMPGLMSGIEASRGRKRKLEDETTEEGTAGFVEKRARVRNGILDDYRHFMKTAVKIVDVDYHAATAQSPEPLQSAGHSSQIISLDLNNKEVSERRLSSAIMISSHIPRRIEGNTEEREERGRFVRTSMRSVFPAIENKQAGNPSPMPWSTSSSDSMNGGSLVGTSKATTELPRNAGVPFNLDIPDLVSVYKGSAQSSETLKNNLKTARVNYPALTIGQNSLSPSSIETPVIGVALRQSVIPQSPLFSRHTDDEIFCSTASKFRQITPSSANGLGHMLHVAHVTQPGNGLPLPHSSDLRLPNNRSLRRSVYEGNYTGQLPALDRLSPGWSEQRKSDERVWKNLEASCERDLQKVSWRRNEGCYDPFPNNHPSACRTDYNSKPESYHSRSIHDGYNGQVRSPEYYPATIPFERLTIEQLQLRTAQACKLNTEDSYKIELVRNKMFQRTDITPKRDQLMGVGLSPPILSRETSNRLATWQRENDKKRSQRSKSLSPSMISNVESGTFGSLESIRRYYKTLGTTETSSCPRTGSAAKQVDRCPDLQQLQFIESKTSRSDYYCMPIDLSSRVRKREQTDLEMSTAEKANSTTVTTQPNIDYCERGNDEISGGYVPQSSHASSPTPGVIPVAPKGFISERSGEDVSGNLLQVQSPPEISWGRMPALSHARSPTPVTKSVTPKGGLISERSGVDVSRYLLQVPSPSNSQPSSRLSSPASMPDSHLPPKKRRIPSYLSSMVDSPTSPKEGLKVSTSPNVDRSPGCYHIPLSTEEPLRIETKAQLEDKADLPDRGVRYGQWEENNCLKNLEDVRWAITPDEDGDLPLHIGVARGSESYVRKCVGIMSRLGASLDVYDSNRKTALQLAVMTSQMNIVEILLNASASPNVLDRNGANSIHLAVKYGELECLKCLLTRSNHVLDLDARNYEGLTALHISVISNQLEATRILLRVGASVNFTDGKTGQTPLHYAAERNIQQMAKLLLVFGANPSSASYSGCTPVQLASAKSHLEMAKMLERSAFVLNSGAVTTRKNLHVKEQ